MHDVDITGIEIDTQKISVLYALHIMYTDFYSRCVTKNTRAAYKKQH